MDPFVELGEEVLEDPKVYGTEPFWSMLKRAHKGIHPKMSPKHLDRYVRKFASRHYLRPQDTLT